jgi:Tol biopolymer transport system component
VKTCLAKDPEERWQSARDVKNELSWISQAGSQAGAPAVVVSRRKSRERFAWAGFALAALAAALFAVGYIRRAPRAPKPILAALIPPEKMFISEFALSPDGSKLAFGAVKPGGQPALWVRSLSEPAARPVPGAEESSFPFWSPDGKFIAFFSQGALKRVDASGGPVLTICDAERGVGGTWNRGGTIVFAPTPTSPLFRVEASGGKPVPVTKLDASLHATAHRYPKFLPDGAHFLYMAANLSAPATDPANSVRIGSLDGKLDKAIVPLASNASYAEGFLFYGRDGALLAQRIDFSRWETKGDPKVIGEHVSGSNWFGWTPFSVAGQTLLYVPLLVVPSQLTWFDRSGRSLGSVGEPRPYNTARLSPDGRRVAAEIFDPARNNSEIWIFDAANGTGTKFVSGNWSDATPVWSPQGDRVAFGSNRKTKGSRPDLWIKSLDGSAEENFLESPDNRNPEDWSPDGRYLSFQAVPGTGKRTNQLWIAETGGSRKAFPFSADADTQGDSRFSPDGRWIAYDSDISGKSEVYVRPFPEGAGRWQISTAGGFLPHWRSDGKEIYYMTPDFKIMAVPVGTSQTFRAGAPSPLFATHPGGGQPFDVSADGQRFLVIAAPSDQASPPFSFVLNWTGLLPKD